MDGHEAKSASTYQSMLPLGSGRACELLMLRAIATGAPSSTEIQIRYAVAAAIGVQPSKTGELTLAFSAGVSSAIVPVHELAAGTVNVNCADGTSAQPGNIVSRRQVIRPSPTSRVRVVSVVVPTRSPPM